MSLEGVSKLEGRNEVETIQRMADLALRREAGASLKQIIQRSITALALLASLGVFEGQAQAQARSIGLQDGGWVGEIISQVTDRAVFSAQSAIDRRQSRDKERINADRGKVIDNLKTVRSRLYWEHAKGHISDAEYAPAKAELDEAVKRAEASPGYRPSLKSKLLTALLQGLKGY